MNTNASAVYVGVDIAKATLQVHLKGRQIEITNGPEGRSQLCKQIGALAAAHVICEATGGYERPLVDAFHQAHIRVSVVNPAQVRAACQAQGQRAKTDRIDAMMLTDYGQRYQPEPTPPVSDIQRQLVDLTRWLKQLVEGRALVKTQCEHHDQAFVCDAHQTLLEHYTAQIKAAEAGIKTLIDGDRELRRRIDALKAIKGVGLRTAYSVLAYMPELGMLNRQEVAALAGLAPWTRESGAMKGTRCIGGGRGEVRRALYMAALSAARSNPVLRPFYQRLRQKGKAHKVALTAVMRKLLIYMNHQIKTLSAAPIETKSGK
jgi:transposase